MSLEGASRDLRARAQRAGLGGLDHHLGRFEQVLGQRFDRNALRSALQNVSELMWQVRQELASSAPSEPRQVNAESHIRASAPPARGDVQPGGGAITPPPFLTVHPDGGAARPPSPPLPVPLQPPAARSPPMVISSRRPPAAPAVAAPTAFDPSRPVPPPPISARVPQAPVLPSPPMHTPSPVQDRAPTPARNPGRILPSPPVPAAREAPPSVAPPPKLQVRTMFGLRAFGRAPQPDDPSGPRASLPDEGSLLGLRRKVPTGSSSASLPRGGRSHVPPPMLSGQLPSLPPARAEEGSRPEFDAILERMGKGGKAPSDTGARRAAKRRVPVQPKAAAGGSSVWWFVAAGGVVISGVLVAGIIAWSRMRQPVDATAGGTGSAATMSSTAPSSSAATARRAPRERLSTDDERFEALISQVHGHGGKESAELRALVDNQAALQSKILEEGRARLHPRSVKSSERRAKYCPDRSAKFRSGSELPEITPARSG